MTGRIMKQNTDYQSFSSYRGQMYKLNLLRQQMSLSSGWSSSLRDSLLQATMYLIVMIFRCMGEDDRPISEIAFEYGFNSKENFTRAFKMEHHILPTGFRAYKNSLKLYDRLVFELSDFEVSHTLVQFPSFELVVLKSDEDVPPLLRNKYNVKGYSKRLSGGRAVVDYDVSDRRMEAERLDW